MTPAASFAKALTRELNRERQNGDLIAVEAVERAVEKVKSVVTWTTLPVIYKVKGLPAATYLCFRVQEVDGRHLLSLIPDAETQHPLDVCSIFADDPNLTAVAYDDAYRCEP